MKITMFSKERLSTWSVPFLKSYHDKIFDMYRYRTFDWHKYTNQDIIDYLNIIYEVICSKRGERS